MRERAREREREREGGREGGKERARERAREILVLLLLGLRDPRSPRVLSSGT